jgi:hypothetical protein
MTWLAEQADGPTPTARVFGLRPEAHARFRELYDGLWDAGVDPRTLEACRRAVFGLVRCEPAGVTTETDADLRAVQFAEQYVLDPHSLTDADFARLHEHFDDAHIATLVLAVAMFDALARFEVALGVAG